MPKIDKTKYQKPTSDEINEIINGTIPANTQKKKTVKRLNF